MKRNLFAHALLALAFTATLASCKKDENPTSAGTTGPFVCKVDGTQFPSDNSKAKAKYVASSTRMLQIIGQTSNNDRTILLNLIPVKQGFSAWTTGTYKISTADMAAGGYVAMASYDYWPNGLSENSQMWTTNPEKSQATDGEIVISSITDTHVKGSFKFKGYLQSKTNGTYDMNNVKDITEGAFDLDIIKL